VTIEILNRRTFLAGSAAAGAGMMLLGNKAFAQSANPNESPMLADLIANGDLPPLADRVPKQPFVVGPGTLVSEEFLDFEVGAFGGTLRVTNLNGLQTHEITLARAMSILRAPDQSTSDPLPAIVSECLSNDDYTEFTLTIREGLKWSDGVPLTTEDVRMLWELYSDERIYPSFPQIVRSQGAGNGAPGALTVVDDLTFKITFDKPYGAFIAQMASWIPGYTLLFRPAHHIKKFHGDYASAEEIAPALQKFGMDTWENLVIQQDIEHWDLPKPYAIGIPTLAPWITVESTPSMIRLERNPYYWKVDTAGNQLPYVDYVEAPNTNDLQTLILNVAAGRYDIVTQYAQLKEMPLYKQNEQTSNIRSVLTGSINNPPLLVLNHDYDYETEGSVWQSLVSDPRFGKAVAHSINKEEVNKNLYFGLFGLDGLTKEGYDPAASNALLDEIGMSERDGDGFRLDPAGGRFELDITTAEIQPDFAPLGELLTSYLQDVGIRTSLTLVSDDLFTQRLNNNEVQAAIHWSDGPIWEPMISIDYMPNHKGQWAPACYEYWSTNGAGGRQPPAYIQEFFEIHESRYAVPPGTPEADAAYQRLTDWFATHYATIWPTGTITKPEVFSARLGNTVKEGYATDRGLDYCMEQVFIRA